MKTTNHNGWLLMNYIVYLLDKHKHVMIMNDYKFKIGDIVKLKQYEQQMIVNKITDDSYVQCVWLNNGCANSELYHESILEIAIIDDYDGVSTNDDFDDDSEDYC